MCFFRRRIIKGDRNLRPLYLGRPRLRNGSFRPVSDSSLRMKRVEPHGRPIRVARRSDLSSSGSPPPSHFVHSFGGQSFIREASSKGFSSLPQWVGALGPRPIPGASDHAGANRVSLDVAHGGLEVRFAQRAGIVTTCEQMPSPPKLAVDVLGVTHVSRAEGMGQTLAIAWKDDQMQVVAHQAVAKNSQRLVTSIQTQQTEIGFAILVINEDVLLTNPPLRDVMGNAEKKKGTEVPVPFISFISGGNGRRGRGRGHLCSRQFRGRPSWLRSGRLRRGRQKPP